MSISVFIVAITSLFVNSVVEYVIVGLCSSKYLSIYIFAKSFAHDSSNSLCIFLLTINPVFIGFSSSRLFMYSAFS